MFDMPLNKTKLNHQGKKCCGIELVYYQGFCFHQTGYHAKVKEPSFLCFLPKAI